MSKNQGHLLQTDEVYEAIKREDFLNRLKAAAPFMVLCAVIILLISVGYAFWQSRHENRLYEQERLYVAILKDTQDNRLGDAKKNLSRLREKKSGFAVLGALQMSNSFQKDVIATNSKVSWNQLRRSYDKILASLRGGNLSLEAFFSVARALSCVGCAIEDKDVKDQVSKFAAQGHSWHEVGLMLNLLLALADHAPAKLEKSIVQWLEAGAVHWHWIPTYIAISELIKVKGDIF